MKTSLLPKDHQQLKKLDETIQKTSISLIAVDTKELCINFIEYISKNFNIIHCNVKNQKDVKNILDTKNSNNVLLINLFENNNKDEIADYLQVYRDDILRYGLKVILMLDLQGMVYVKDLGDFMGKVGFSHVFIDHRFNYKLESDDREFDGLVKQLKILDTNNYEKLYEVLYLISQRAYLISDYTVSLEYGKRALDLAKVINNSFYIATMLGNNSIIYSALGEYDRALEDAVEAHGIFMELENATGMANELNNIGFIFMNTAKYEEALVNFIEALNIYAEIEDLKGNATVLGNIAFVYYSLSDYDNAMEYYNKILEMN